jgi:hypothetical protein
VPANVVAAGDPDDPEPEREASGEVAGEDEGKLFY